MSPSQRGQGEALSQNKMTTDQLTYEATELLKKLISIESFSTQENKTGDAIENFFQKH